MIEKTSDTNIIHLIDDAEKMDLVDDLLSTDEDDDNSTIDFDPSELNPSIQQQMDPPEMVAGNPDFQITYIEDEDQDEDNYLLDMEEHIFLRN